MHSNRSTLQHCTGEGERGADALSRAAERVRQAAAPAYVSLFPSVSNQPAGMPGSCPVPEDSHAHTGTTRMRRDPHVVPATCCIVYPRLVAAGLKFLVDMRADVLDVIRHGPAGAAALRALSEALRQAAPARTCMTGMGRAGVCPGCKTETRKQARAQLEAPACSRVHAPAAPGACWRSGSAWAC